MKFSTSDVTEPIEVSEKEKDTFSTPKMKRQCPEPYYLVYILCLERLVYYISKIIFQKRECGLSATLLKS